MRHFADRVAVTNRACIIETGSLQPVCEASTAGSARSLEGAAPVPS